MLIRTCRHSLETLQTRKLAGKLKDFQGLIGELVDFSGGTLLDSGRIVMNNLIRGQRDPKSKVGGAKPGDLVMRALDRAQESLYVELPPCVILEVKTSWNSLCETLAIQAANWDQRLVAAGQMICMTGGHGNAFGRVADGPHEVIKAVREQVHAGSDVIKIMAAGGVMTPGVNPEDADHSLEELTVGIHEGHRFNRTCAGHAQGSEGVLNE